MSLVKQELFTFPEHLSLPSVFSEIRVTRSLVLCVCFVDRCPFVLLLLALVLSVFLSFGPCVVCSSSICEFWLPLWCLQILLVQSKAYFVRVLLLLLLLFALLEYTMLFNTTFHIITIGSVFVCVYFSFNVDFVVKCFNKAND